jgi:TatD DNase family protein
MSLHSLRWIDSHCHLDALEFQADRDHERQEARGIGVHHCVIPAVESANFLSVQALARRYHDSYALGIHPLYTLGARAEDLLQLEQQLAQNLGDPHLVALGEIGLDGFVQGLDWSKQVHFYTEQLRLARKHELPVILHVRRSSDALLKGLRDEGTQGGIAHAFNGSWVQAQQFIEMGFCLGFGGAITYERALHLRRLLRDIPLSGMVLETDAPDIAPHWLYVTARERERGVKPKRNSPKELLRIAQVVAELKGVSLEALCEHTSQNVRRVLPRMSLQAPLALAHGPTGP